MSNANWKSNTTLEQLASWLKTRQNVVVLTHVKPDGDAAGSTLGLVRALNMPRPWVRAGRAEVWYFGPTPPWLRSIAGDTRYRSLGDGGPPSVDGVDAVVVLDTGSWAQLEAIHEWLTPLRDITAVIDHHMQGDPEVGSKLYIDPSAAAVCQPVSKLCQLLLDVDSATKLPAAVAEPLYLGMATDTGWFRHSNVSRAVMNAAGELLEAGANHVRLYQVVEQQETVSRLRLLSRALASLELHDEDRLAIMTLTRADFSATGAQPGESGGFVDYSQAIPSVQVTCLLTEALPSDFGQNGAVTGPLTKVSLRSKPTDHAVDVNVMARTLGGGGHIRAAGARTLMDIPQTKAAVIKLLMDQTRAL